jgi:hypothetical protein
MSVPEFFTSPAGDYGSEGESYLLREQTESLCGCCQRLWAVEDRT